MSCCDKRVKAVQRQLIFTAKHMHHRFVKVLFGQLGALNWVILEVPLENT